VSDAEVPEADALEQEQEVEDNTTVPVVEHLGVEDPEADVIEQATPVPTDDEDRRD
jgi:hypothetical protein